MPDDPTCKNCPHHEKMTLRVELLERDSNDKDLRLVEVVKQLTDISQNLRSARVAFYVAAGMIFAHQVGALEAIKAFLK